jgi:hypothetical protein
MSTNGKAEYLIAQYSQDPFRHEARNVGVIVIKKNGRPAAKFAGETSPGQIDGRSIRWLPHADIYRHWIDSWREELLEESDASLADRLMDQNGGNYNIIAGGEVTDTGADSANDICQFLFANLVSTRTDEFAEVAEGAPPQQFKADVHNAFKELNILSGTAPSDVRHPIIVDTWLLGRNAEYNPAFFQQNGTWWVMEPVNFSAQNKRIARDHASYASVMFKDIKAKHRKTVPIALVMADANDLDDRNVKSILPVLKNSGELVMWNDDQDRAQFLGQRHTIAVSDDA